MSLTPQEIAQANKITGLNVPVDGQPPVTSRADQIRALAKEHAPKVDTTPSLGSRIKTDIQNRGSAMAEDIAGTSEESKGEPAIVRGTQAAAQGAGAVLDTGSEIVKSLLHNISNRDTNIDPATGKESKPIDWGKLTPQFAKDFVGDVKGGLGMANDELGTILNDWATKHPEASKNLISALKTTKATGDIAGTVASADVAGMGGNKLPVLGEDVKNIPSLVKSIPSKTENLVTETTGKIKNATTNGIKTAKDFVNSKTATNTLDALSATEETMTKGERLKAIDNKRQITTKLGGVKYTPTETEKRAAEILDGKLTSNPVKNVPIVKAEIATKGAEAEKYLAKNPVKISAQEQADMFSSARKEAEKNLTETELKAYDEQMKLFLKQIPGRGGYNTETFYKALKDYESNIADHLPRGKEALLDPTGIANAKIRAASDIRTVVRDAIAERHPEFKQKMFDLASLYDVKGTVIAKAEKLQGNAVTRFAKKHPYITGAIAGEAGKKLITGSY